MNIYFIVFFNVIKFCLLFCRMLITFFLLKTNCLYKEQWFKNWYFHLHIFKYLISYFFFVIIIIIVSSILFFYFASLYYLYSKHYLPATLFHTIALLSHSRKTYYFYFFNCFQVQFSLSLCVFSFSFSFSYWFIVFLSKLLSTWFHNLIE